MSTIDLNINQEKQDILDIKDDNILVTANPGTGKTLLLAHKYLSLIRDGTEPKDILCLTFTEKAKSEMEKRILELQKKSRVQMDVSQLNVSTFHSYALSQLEQKDIISSNLLRSEIYLYIKQKDLFNYQDTHIIDEIVPQIDTLIQYLKSFGVLPEDINIKKAEKELLKNKDLDKKYSDSEKVLLLKTFIEIYKKYEDIKKPKGYDYADLLIEFLKLEKKRKFEYVLIDELQDLNRIEAKIALGSADRFVAVGDKKQAIFGFQGGSIINFDLFKRSRRSILSENFRSTDQILFYAKNYFITKTKNTAHKGELKDLKNATGYNGNMPIIIKAERSDQVKRAADVLESMINNPEKTNGSDKTTAVIMRRNAQITKMSTELENRNVNFTTTFFSGSENTKDDILNFIRGVMSDDVQIIKSTMFTPYSPVTIQQAFKLANKKYGSAEDILKEIKPFKKLRNKIKDKYDLLKLFRDRILPIAVSHGKEHYYAAKKTSDAFFEALELLGDKDLDNVINYVRLYGLSMEEAEKNGPVTLTTVHKAKGREFNNVIYLPAPPVNKKDIFDPIVQSILGSKKINAEEELQEESFRIDFVAFTRAKDQLLVITTDENKYFNEEFSRPDPGTYESRDPVPEPAAYRLEAYKLFVNKEYEEAKKLLKDRDHWLIDFIKDHFKKLDSVSFSSIDNTKPFEYLTGNILKIRTYSPALNVGSEVHSMAEKKLKGEEHETDDVYKPYEKNIDKLLASESIAEYPEVHCVEEFFEVPLPEISDIEEDIKFRGKIDAVLKKDGKYLMLDWKTDRTQTSKHRQQLEIYRKAFCHLNDVTKDNVQVAIAYIGLRPQVNTGEVHWELDTKEPGPTAFGTVKKRLKKIVDWKNNPDDFIRELSGQKGIKSNEILWKNVVEQYLYEYQKDQK